LFIHGEVFLTDNQINQTSPLSIENPDLISGIGNRTESLSAGSTILDVGSGAAAYIIEILNDLADDPAHGYHLCVLDACSGSDEKATVLYGWLCRKILTFSSLLYV